MFRFTKAERKPRVIYKYIGKSNVLKSVKKTTDILSRLRSFLDAEEPQLVQWLETVWGGQQNAITYKELRVAVLAGDLTVERLEQWRQDYSKFVTERLVPSWAMAMTAGVRGTDTTNTSYDPYTGAAGDYIHRRGAELVTNITAEQRNAIHAMINQAAFHQNITADSLSMMIRPTIGLTAPQAHATLNYYSMNLDTRLDTGMNQARAEKLAREATARYAAQQHRYRAMNIARTELATAYNRGMYEGTKDMQARGLLGDCVKVWLTADDERTCKQCGALEGERVNTDALFSTGVLLPPNHPSCRCSVSYEQISEPVVPVVPTPYANVENNGIMDYNVIGDNDFSGDSMGQDIEYNNNADIINLPDILIGHSLGAQAYNYDIETPDGEVLHITEGTRITNVQVIAGKGRNRQIDVIDILISKYGGDVNEWQKVKGIGYVNYEDESYKAEIHWYQESTIGKVEFKLKPQLGGEYFID